jgi:CRISPR-associated protein Cas5t
LKKKENGRRKLMLHLRLKAPFGTFRTFTAGSYRPTAPFITPSAAYGLILNISGIESRYDDGHAAMTLMKFDLPQVEIALGAISFPETQSVYQQLHNYPVGATGKDRAKETKGAKYNIQPVRREFLSGIDAYVCVRGNDQLEVQVKDGLRHGLRSLCEGRPRYGIPFLGDNNFMIDVLREEHVLGPAFWYRRLTGELGPITGRCRLTAWIDRADMTRTVSYLYAPTKGIVAAIPEDAWTLITPPSKTLTKGEKRSERS